MTLVRLVKNWDWPNIMRQTPDELGVWDDIQFTFDEVEECDYVVIFNYPVKNINVNVPRDSVWALMQEPYIPGYFDWMVEGHEKYHKVLTHLSMRNKKKYIPHPTMSPWFVNRTYNELISIPQPEKYADKISCVVSNKTFFPGHKKRVEFVEQLKLSDLEIEWFGKGVNEIEDKWDGLAPYKYSIAIENSSTQHYWTEKIADCFLSYTIPIYYGCTNIDKYFPRQSYIQIDINSPQRAISIIKDAIESNLFAENYSYLLEARNLVLNKYQMFPALVEKIRSHQSSGVRENICIDMYKRSLKMRLINKLRRIRKRIL